MPRRKKLDRYTIKKMAVDQILLYFKDIEECWDKNIELANRFVEICRRISMRCKVRIPRRHKLTICNKCKRILIPGKTARVRIRHNKQKHQTITCLYCKNYKRLYIDKNKNKSRKIKRS